MIGDYEVDLTLEHKFGNKSSISLGFGRELEEEVRVQRSIPWFRKRSDVSLFGIKQRRKYGDYISDDYGTTVRRCSDGKWFFAGGNKEELSQAEKYFAYYINEEMGGERGQVIMSCICCGKLFFSRGHLECTECRTGMRSEVYNKLINKPKRVYQLTGKIRIGGSL